MPRFRTVPLTLAQLGQDGPPVRLRDLAAMTGLSIETLRLDVSYGHLHAFKRCAGISSPYFVDRDVARLYLSRMGFHVERRESVATVIPIDLRRAARG